VVGVPDYAKPGDRVMVPWGFEEVEGEVVDVYPTGLGPRAIVRIDLVSGDETTVTLPIDALLPMGREASAAVGSSSEYEEAVRSALRRTARLLGVAIDDAKRSRTAVDLLLSASDMQVAVTIKHYSSSRQVPSDVIAALSGLTREIHGVLLITNVPLSDLASSRLDDYRHRGVNMQHAHWRNSRDDSRLERVTARAVGGPSGRFEIFEDNAGQFRFRLRARNGEVVAIGEPHKTRQGALRAVEAVRRNSHEADFVDLTS
jgi:uncharacterized protein